MHFSDLPLMVHSGAARLIFAPRFVSAVVSKFDGAENRNLKDLIHKNIDKLYEEEACIDDAAENAHLRMACVVRSSYETLLRENFDRQSVFQALEEAMKEETSPLHMYGTVVASATLLSRNFGMLEKSAKMLNRSVLRGEAFETEIHRNDEYLDHNFKFVVKRCFLQEYFERHRLPRLSLLFCLFDDSFGQAFNETGRLRYASLCSILSPYFFFFF